ncbi:RNA-directed DNA polymerase from mobile element jockey [Xyrichtys novacula]|uniref:RNA-directed DNA polymerase from mobile element jockey n=1 Tax=Xyrichtys novacula TaxID=13765 RepID=A0AAV1FAC9_XYRNO|nr:RNA-directed DNA polymerase from mobile element jockey [Xyrichtys novacula]
MGWRIIMVLSILQWNARSLITNGQEFKKFISGLQDKPTIICIQETWMREQWDFVIHGYTAVRNDRKNGIGGGVATFIKDGIGFNTGQIGMDHESITVKIWTGRYELAIINYYNPCKRLSMDTLNKVLGEVQGKILWCGDFNAHSTLWGSERTDSNGSIVEEFIEDKGLVCLNDGRGTRYDCVRNKESAIDLTLMSNEMAGITNWEVLDEILMGSDHYPVISKVGVEMQREEERRVPRWKIQNAKWDAYQAVSRNIFEELHEEQWTGVDEWNERVVAAIIQSADGTIPKVSGGRSVKSVPWWDNNCRQAIRARNRAFRLLKKQHTMETLIQYRRSQAVVKRTIRAAKRVCWRKYCSEIGQEVQLSEVWGMIRKMSGIKRNITIPILKKDDRTAVSNLEKATLLAETLIQVHSSENISTEAKQHRQNVLTQNTWIREKKQARGDDLDLPFNLYELRRAVAKTRQSSPGKDDVCYCMLDHMDDRSLGVILKLFNKVWESGEVPQAWKHSVIVPILKPGKGASDPSNYRPIALTSQLGKTMEKMVTERLMFFLESHDLFSSHQSGFRKGRNTMDSVLSLESDIRKAQTNKEIVMAVFFDVEKAYDMLWKEGLLIKLDKMGVGGKLYNWVLSFLFRRTIEVRVAQEFSPIYEVENGTPQGSVCSPVIFNCMINDIFEEVGGGISKSLFADDGALWVRGRNQDYLQKKLQAAVDKVEQWANRWGFKLSVAKTQVICFAKRHKEVSIKLYDQTLEQAKVVRFLGVLFDEKLTWKQHIEKLRDKCKNVNNLMRCMAGRDWGATRKSLLNIYQAMMRSRIDYGSVAYMSAAESHLKKLDVEQAKGLRICSGAFKTSPVAALQVEVGEEPLRIRRVKHMLAYWVYLQGDKRSHPAKAILEECSEHDKTNFLSLGWVGNEKAESVGLCNMQFVSSHSLPEIPPWVFQEPTVDFGIQDKVKKKSGNTGDIVQRYIEQNYANKLLIFTDGSKDPKTGRTGAAVFVPEQRLAIRERATDHASVYSVELLAIILALKWMKGGNVVHAVIASDSYAALESIKTMKSCRQDLVMEIHQLLHQIQNRGGTTRFVWVPAHAGVEGNEEVDTLAKQAVRAQTIKNSIPLGRAEGKSIIKTQMQRVWQEYWDINDTGRHFYRIQSQVGGERVFGRSRKEEVAITRLRLGHTGLNSTQKIISKHPTGKCQSCNVQETVEHVLMECREYEREREVLKNGLKKENIGFTLRSVLQRTKESNKHVQRYLRRTGLVKRI